MRYTSRAVGPALLRGGPGRYEGTPAKTVHDELFWRLLPQSAARTSSVGREMVSPAVVRILSADLRGAGLQRLGANFFGSSRSPRYYRGCGASHAGLPGLRGLRIGGQDRADSFRTWGRAH